MYPWNDEKEEILKQNSILLLSLMFGPEMRTCNKTQESRVYAVEMKKEKKGMMVKAMKMCIKHMVWKLIQLE